MYSGASSRRACFWMSARFGRVAPVGHVAEARGPRRGQPVGGEDRPVAPHRGLHLLELGLGRDQEVDGDERAREVAGVLRDPEVVGVLDGAGVEHVGARRLGKQALEDLVVHLAVVVAHGEVHLAAREEPVELGHRGGIRLALLPEVRLQLGEVGPERRRVLRVLRTASNGPARASGPPAMSMSHDFRSVIPVNELSKVKRPGFFRTHSRSAARVRGRVGDPLRL